jgi:hypothetical protein
MSLFPLYYLSEGAYFIPSLMQINEPPTPYGIILSEDNPFKEQAERMLKETNGARSGIIAQEEVTITMRRTYMPMGFTKVFKNKELLNDLNPYACKVLVYMALHLEMGQEKMKISREAVGISKHNFRQAMLDLLLKRIIVNAGKREWYWVNITLLIVGNIRKHG